MASNNETREPTGEITSVTPTANTRTRRSRNYRTRKGSIAPKDVMPKNLNMIGWTDEDGNETFKRRTLSLTLDQLRAVCGQLGYLPLNIVSIGAANKDPNSSGAPQVAILYPLAMNKLVRQGREHKIKKRDKTGEEEAKEEKDENADAEAAAHKEESQKWDPFPTTCWLTCPELHARICKLEDKGWISKLESKLQNSEEYEKQMAEAHQAYINYRWALLSPRDQQMVEIAGWDRMLKSVGIAGIRVFNAVKCLHCHYAHYLARPSDGNVVGQWVDALLKEDGDGTVLEVSQGGTPTSSSSPLASFRGSPRSPHNRRVNDSLRNELGSSSSGSGGESTEEEGFGDPGAPSSPPDKSIAGGPFSSPLGEDKIPSPQSMAKSSSRHLEEEEEEEEEKEEKEEGGKGNGEEGGLSGLYCAVEFLTAPFWWLSAAQGPGEETKTEKEEEEK